MNLSNQAIALSLKLVPKIICGLLCYFLIWGITHRIPVSEPLTLDLRKSPQDAARCISFCSSLADNLHGFPGHAYVVWSPRGKVDVFHDHSMGFMPAQFEDQIPSLFRVVPGGVLDHSEGNYRNLDRLTIIVSPSQYEDARRAAEAWPAGEFQVGQRDCIAFVAYLARKLNLNVSDSSYAFPQDYVHQLKSMNNRSFHKRLLRQGFIRKIQYLFPVKNASSMKNY